MSDWHKHRSLSGTGGVTGSGPALTSCTCCLAMGAVCCAIVAGSLHPVLTLSACLALPAGLLLAARRLRRRRARSPAVFAFACACIGLGYACLAVSSLVLRVVLLWEHLTLNLMLILACLSIRWTRAAAAAAADPVSPAAATAGEPSLLESGSTAVADACAVCERQTPQLDHHCWWLDCCIGRANRRHYMLTLALCIATGCYGIQLTLTSICTPAIYLDWFLLPADCRFLYYDGLHSVAASACAFVSACVALLCCELALQVGLVTAGATWQEVARTAHGPTSLPLGLLSRVVRRRGSCAASWLDLCCSRR